MMRNKHTIRLLASVVVAGLPLAGAYAANFPGTAATPTIYQVTLKKVELCTSSDGAGSCAGAFVVGSSTKAFDIAAVGAGAAVGSYANLSNLPIGTTFTHVRATVDYAIVARAFGANGGATCYTSASGGGSASASSSATMAGGPAETTTIYVPHIGTYTTSGGAVTLTEADFQTGTRGYIKRPNDTDVQVTYQLTGSYTPVRNRPPQVTVKFDVTGAVGFLRTGGATCDVFPEPPSVTITIQ